MCLQDYQLGNNIRAISKAAEILAGDNLLLKPDPARVGVWFSAGSNAPLQVSVDLPGDQEASFDVSANNPPVYISMATHGDLSTREFRSFNAFSPQGMLVIEFFLEQSVFQRSLTQVLESEGWPETGRSSSAPTSSGSKRPTR